MKKLTYFSILIFIFLNSSAQNVGIGTTTPTEKLEINNTSRSTLKISTNNLTDTAQLMFSNRFGALHTDFLITQRKELGLFFSSKSDAIGNTSDNSLVITPGGNIGLGVAAPVNKFEVLGNANITGNLGLGIAPVARLHINGNTVITSFNSLEFGGGVTKETNAGKIGYQIFTSDALDIVGAGTTASNRKIRFWNEGGASFEGGINVATGKVTQGNTGTASMLPYAYGTVSSTGVVLNGSGNFTINRVSSGDYWVYLNNGESFSSSVHTAILSISQQTTPLFIQSYESFGSGQHFMVVLISNSSVPVDAAFSFVMFKP